MSTMALMGNQNNSLESIPSFYQVEPRDQIQVVRLGSKPLYPLSHLHSPLFHLKIFTYNICTK